MLFFGSIRVPQREESIKKQVIVIIEIILFGFILGVVQKWLDESASQIFPLWLQQLDISNYFGRLSIWILLGTVISVQASSPLKASIHTFCFFISMLAGYYLYCYYIVGFLPISYMMIWVVISFLSIFMAYICWFAKGEGVIAIIISNGILGILFAQAFSLTQGFYVYHIMEVITWIVGVVVLYRQPKEFIVVLGLSLVIAIMYQSFIPYWG